MHIHYLTVLEVRILTEQKLRCWQDFIPTVGSREDSVLCLFQLLGTAHIPLLMVLFHLQSQPLHSFNLCSCSHISSMDAPAFVSFIKTLVIVLDSQV